jgi:hypothetical protein
MMHTAGMQASDSRQCLSRAAGSIPQQSSTRHWNTVFHDRKTPVLHCWQGNSRCHPPLLRCTAETAALHCPVLTPTYHPNPHRQLCCTHIHKHTPITRCTHKQTHKDHGKIATSATGSLAAPQALPQVTRHRGSAAHAGLGTLLLLLLM